MATIAFTAEPGKPEVLITRMFEVPRTSLFRAYTDPLLIPQWWTNTTVDKMDVRPGGVWRYVTHAGGQESGVYGVYHEITAPARLVYTFEAEGMPGHVQLITVTLEERNGKTLLTQQSVFQSVQDRDTMAQYGMETGAKAGFDLLEAVVTKL
jgi:uncharacterized protein YndB with AHSA1/START domain